MDYDSIKKIIKVFEASSLSLLEAEDNGFKIKMEKSSVITVPEPIKIIQPFKSVPNEIPVPTPVKNDGAQECIDFNKLKEVKSPMVGVYYSAANTDSEPFVSVGSKVKKGDTLCIIEAMKMMNEIVSEYDGEIVDICVANGQVVEYSQLLFKIY